MKLISIIILCLLLGSCQNPELGTEYKNQNGFYVCSVIAPKLSTSLCSNDEKFTSPAPFTLASFGKSIDESAFPEHSVYIFDSNEDCSETAAFFPVGIITLTNQNSKRTITIGLPVDPLINKTEITDFFYFQVNYVKQLKTTTDWIENNYNKEWLVTGWQDEKAAKANLEKIIRGF